MNKILKHKIYRSTSETYPINQIITEVWLLDFKIFEIVLKTKTTLPK